MTNLNSYTIAEHLYTIGNQYVMGSTTFKIESIINVNDTVFFFCSRIGEKTHTVRVTSTVLVETPITPIHSLIFHHRVLETVQPSGN